MVEVITSSMDKQHRQVVGPRILYSTMQILGRTKKKKIALDSV